MTDLKLLRYLNKHCNTVYLSTGTANILEIKRSIKTLSNVETKILHCVSEYPLNFKNANLRAIELLKENCPKNEIGYSDHTIGNLASTTAIALGATILENHFNISKSSKVTDHIISATYKEINKLRKSRKNILIKRNSMK